ncbi:MAG: MotA/TolQ/ExbB proton channel family protein [Phycisphaeraceae bacterium]|nr:MotA/TolQ/ExbB proton channel family protein [Phycisphaeraceae bacterium]
MLATTDARSIMDLGGWVMWPLLGLSILGLAMVFERALFWMRTLRIGGGREYRKLLRALAAHDRDAVLKVVDRGRGVHSKFAGMVARRAADGKARGGEAGDVAGGMDDAHVGLAIESVRPSLERFMPALSTIITVSPMLGILGTVTGIIASFEAFAQQGASAELGSVGRGIAEALWSTAAGLTVTVVLLFPYNFFRALLDRMLSRLEMIGSAMVMLEAEDGKTPSASSTPDSGGAASAP